MAYIEKNSRKAAFGLMDAISVRKKAELFVDCVADHNLDMVAVPMEMPSCMFELPDELISRLRRCHTPCSEL